MNSPYPPFRLEAFFFYLGFFFSWLSATGRPHPNFRKFPHEGAFCFEFYATVMPFGCVSQQICFHPPFGTVGRFPPFSIRARRNGEKANFGPPIVSGAHFFWGQGAALSFYRDCLAPPDNPLFCKFFQPSLFLDLRFSLRTESFHAL